MGVVQKKTSRCITVMEIGPEMWLIVMKLYVF